MARCYFLKEEESSLRMQMHGIGLSSPSHLSTRSLTIIICCTRDRCRTVHYKWKTHQLSFILYYRGTYCPSSLLPSHLSLYTSPGSSPTRSLCLCIETLEWKINLLSDICRALALYKRFGGNSFQNYQTFFLLQEYPLH